MGLPAFFFLKREGRADQPHMCECLGKVSQRVSCFRIDLFRVQSQTIFIP